MFGSSRAQSNPVLTIANLLLGLQICSQLLADLEWFLPSLKLKSVLCSAPQGCVAFISVKSGFQLFAGHGEKRIVFQRNEFPLSCLVWRHGRRAAFTGHLCSAVYPEHMCK